MKRFSSTPSQWTTRDASHARSGPGRVYSLRGGRSVGQVILEFRHVRVERPLITRLGYRFTAEVADADHVSVSTCALLLIVHTTDHPKCLAPRVKPGTCVGIGFDAHLGFALGVGVSVGPGFGISLGLRHPSGSSSAREKVLARRPAVDTGWYPGYLGVSRCNCCKPRERSGVSLAERGTVTDGAIAGSTSAPRETENADEQQPQNGDRLSSSRGSTGHASSTIFWHPTYVQLLVGLSQTRPLPLRRRSLGRSRCPRAVRAPRRLRRELPRPLPRRG